MSDAPQKRRKGRAYRRPDDLQYLRATGHEPIPDEPPAARIETNYWFYMNLGNGNRWVGPLSPVGKG